MNVRLGIIGAGAIFALIVTSGTAPAQPAPPKVKQPLQIDLAGLPNQETLVQIVEFPANAATPWHTHPDGHEIATVLEGIWIAEGDGKETRTLKAGDSVYVAPNAVHRAYNDASGPTKIIVIRIKPKDKPVTTPFTR
jgi:quercetin dioxygenase-like cupin family protein